ncbi:alpha-galactosidase [Mucilaginibacter sp. BJC16-A38]|uniref:alpha-galactosidase n=1 Tax=Mucilaginibacter phenanthrenivorans TaxID=1234842 RepID=UPI0021588685|nr:alpha-galactosidase [Mucilaginibacter phenanthrenivorans]MCR8561669.1 alpha-galactosidase [Mucilaginibacter phenanthrenivorans]
MKFKQCFLVFFMPMCFAANAQTLPVWNAAGHPGIAQDWLVKPVATKAGVFKTADGRDIVLYNGLLKRVFRITPNIACTDYTNLTTGRQLLRAIREEARLVINGKSYNVGGLKGQKEKAYLLPEWVDSFTADPQDFAYVSYEVKPITAQLAYKSTNWSPGTKYGTGKAISFLFKAGAPELAGLEVRVNYEIYDGMPLIVKSLSIANKGDKTFKLDRVVNEVLGMVEEDSAVDGSLESMKKPQGIYFETNYAYNNAMRYTQSDQTSHWKTDSTYTSQVNYNLKTPVLFENYEDKAPGIELAPGEQFNSVRTHELLMNSYDREARGMAVRRMYSAVAPWTLENPIFMHLVSKNDEQVKTAIDQCAATGYEALILSFGSHLNVEDTSAANVKRWKQMADYAHSRHIKIGCYSLFSSRSINPETDVIDPKTNKPGGAFFGNAPCFGSKWGLWYRDNIEHFFAATNFDIFENDGPYPGDVCASTTHPGHKGLDDSQWRQMEIQKGLYHWLKQRGVYINAPDWYFLDGSNKIAIGYREVNFSLPRANQKILNRQNIFDGTWDKTPSMSWGFVPLTQYQGGGAAATLEPLSAHLKDYEQLMMQYYGSGVQACYRGPRLYDTKETEALVIKVISWYKKYRAILSSDIVHLRRADGRDWDGILHVNPALKTKGMMMLYNPTKETITRTVKIPLYYTGLTTVANVRVKDGAIKTYKLNRDYTIDFTFTIAPEDYTWVTVE